MSDEARTATIRKGVTRKLSTAQYETCDIFAEISQEVTWTTVKELMKKSESVGKLVLLDYNGFELQTLEELNLSSRNVSKKGGPNKPLTKEDYDGL